MDPFLSGGDMIRSVRKEGTTYADAPTKFEAGTEPYTQAHGRGPPSAHL